MPVGEILMKNHFLSLVELPPPGFVYTPQLKHRDVRGTAFALYADSVENAEEALKPFAAHIAGLIVTWSDTFIWEHRSSMLFHLGIPPETRTNPEQRLFPLLDLIEALQEREGRIRGLNVQIARAADDRKRIEEDFARSRESLIEEIAERRITEQELRESEDRFRTIFDSVSEAIIIYDRATGVMVDVNRSMRELFGYTRDEALQLAFGAISSGESPYTREDAIAQNRKLSEGPLFLEWHCRTKAGTLFWGEMNVRLATIRKRECILVTVRDITERKESQLERERLSGELQAALAAKVKQLSGFLPICSSCKKIRNDQGYWSQIESYIREHSDAEFTHSLCPDCANKLYSGILKKTY